MTPDNEVLPSELFVLNDGGQHPPGSTTPGETNPSRTQPQAAVNRNALELRSSSYLCAVPDAARSTPVVLHAPVHGILGEAGSRRSVSVLSARWRGIWVFFRKIEPRPEVSTPTSGGGGPLPSPAVRGLVCRGLRAVKLHHVAHLLFCTWGLGVLLLHVRAVTRSQEVVLGCRQSTTSWFATAYPCSVYTHNCYRQGASSPSEDSWDHLDQLTLVYLTIAHCSELKVPNRIQSFPNLLGLQFHNTTLVEWTQANAISASKHTKLVTLVLAKTNMTGLPDGMLEPLPDSLVDIELSHTSLTALPSDLHERWHPLLCFYLEHSLLAEFPETLVSLEVTELSLHGNLIEKVPELADKHQVFYQLEMSANPLRELPEALGEDTSFSSFGAERTLLKALPAWVSTSVEDTMFLAGTPFCEERGGETETERATGSPLKLACVERETLSQGKFPLEVVDPLIPLCSVDAVGDCRDGADTADNGSAARGDEHQLQSLENQAGEDSEARRRRLHREKIARYRRKKSASVEQMKAQELLLAAQLKSMLDLHASQSQTYRSSAIALAGPGLTPADSTLPHQEQLFMDAYVRVTLEKDRLALENERLQAKFSAFNSLQHALQERFDGETFDEKYEQQARSSFAFDPCGYYVKFLDSEAPFFYVPYTKEEVRARAIATERLVYEWQAQNLRSSREAQAPAHQWQDNSAQPHAKFFGWTVNIQAETALNGAFPVKMMRFRFTKTFRNPARSMSELLDADWEVVQSPKLFKSLQSVPVEYMVIQTCDKNLSVAIWTAPDPSPQPSGIKHRILSGYSRGAYVDPRGRQCQIVTSTGLPPKVIPSKSSSGGQSTASVKTSDQELFRHQGVIYKVFAPGDHEGEIDVEYGGNLHILTDELGQFLLLELGNTLVRLENILFPFRVLPPASA